MEVKPLIAVTGGAGYIGSHTVVELQQRGIDCLIIDNFSNSQPEVLDRIESITGVRPKIAQGSVCDKEFLQELFATYEFTGVIHFAAYKSVNESVDEPLKYYDNNLSGLISLVSVMKESKVRNLIFSSSCTVYGTPSDSREVSESTPTGVPNSPYGFTKLMGEQILRDFSTSNPDFSITLLRYFNPVGAHSSGKIGELPVGIPNNILPYISQVAAGVLEQLTIFGNDYETPDGTCLRDFIHVSDVAEAHIQALEVLSGKPGLELYNLGTGTGTSVLELVKHFEDATGRRIPYKFGPRRAGDVVAISANVEKATRELGWRTSRSVRDAVRDAWNWEKQLRGL